MRISDWSSDVCSSDLRLRNAADAAALAAAGNPAQAQSIAALLMSQNGFAAENLVAVTPGYYCASTLLPPESRFTTSPPASAECSAVSASANAVRVERSEEHTSEHKSLMRISYAGFYSQKNKYRT